MKTKQPTIPMHNVKSSQIESVGHHGDTLAVKFKSGGTYHYHGITPAQFADLQKAESIGAHLGKFIKPHHKFKKLEDPSSSSNNTHPKEY